MNAAAKDAAPAARFIDNGDGTVTNTRTGLMFTQATLCDEEVAHKEAGDLCSSCTVGGHSDWRLPTVQELFALADHGRHDPAIDTDVFPDTKSDWYWSSTTCAWSSVRASCVDFYYGLVDSSPRGNSNAFVRAVRVPPGQ